jgi:hypothetical protein
MKRRIQPFIICLLTSALLSVLPAALAFDMATPVDRWEHWYWPGQPNPVPDFSFPDHLPPLLRTEVWLFRALVTPPAFVAARLGAWPGEYGLPFVTAVVSEGKASLPPAAMALQHLRVAFPFWLVASLVVYESAAAIRRRWVGRRVA